MQLRANVRPPGRYREEEIEELPPNPRFVVRTTAFNPNLRAAVFPTLEWNETLSDRLGLSETEAEEEEEEEGLQEDRLEGRLERPALVFRDTRTVPIMEQEDGLMQMPDGRWVATLEPGEFSSGIDWGSDTDPDQDTPEERWIPPALTRQKYWSDLSDGTHLILMREFTQVMAFTDAVLYLELEEQEILRFMDLCVDEIRIVEQVKRLTHRILERRMALTKSRNFSGEGDEWGRIFDEEMAKGSQKMSAAAFISNQNVADAKNFLRNYRFKEEFGQIDAFEVEKFRALPTFTVMSSIMDRLDDYVGSNTNLEVLDFGEDFIGYLPVENLVFDEDEPANSAPTEKAVEVPDMRAAAQQASQQFQPGSPPKLQSLPSELASDKAPTKTLTKDSVPAQIMRRRGRPRKADKIVGPSRLREVTNAADLEAPRQSPTIKSASGASGTNSTTTPSTKPVTPPRSIQNLGRTPFKDFSPTILPPKHSGSFLDCQPDQPAPTSPPKGTSGSASAPVNKSAPYIAPYAAPSQSATGVQTNLGVDHASSVQSTASGENILRIQSASSDQQASSIKLTHSVQSALGGDRNDSDQATESLTVPKPSMRSRPGPSSTTQGARIQSGASQMDQPQPSSSTTSELSAAPIARGAIFQTRSSEQAQFQPPNHSKCDQVSIEKSVMEASDAQQPVKHPRTPSEPLAPSRTVVSAARQKAAHSKVAHTMLKHKTMQDHPATSKNLIASGSEISLGSFQAPSTNTSPTSISSIKKSIAQLSKSTNQSAASSPEKARSASISGIGSCKTSAISLETPAYDGSRVYQEPASDTSIDKDESPQGNAPSQLNKLGNPGKLRFNVKISGSQSHLPRPSTSTSQATSVASPVKRVHDDETDKALIEEKLTKKPRLDQGPSGIVNSIIDNARLIGYRMNLFKGWTDGTAKHDDTTAQPVMINENDGAKTQSTNASPKAVTSDPNPHNKPTGATECLLDVPNAADMTTSPRTITKLQQPKNEAQILDATPNLPNTQNKTSASRSEAAQILGTTSSEVIAAESAEAVDYSKGPGAPPPNSGEKTPSAGKHARTGSQSSVESVDQILTSPPRARINSPERTPSTTKSNVDVQIPAKRAASRPTGSFERERSPAKKIKCSKASSAAAAGPKNGGKDRKRTEIEVQIPVTKRTALELSFGSFEKEESPARNLKIGGPSLLPTASGLTSDATQGKKCINAKAVRRAKKSKSPSEHSEYSSVSTTDAAEPQNRAKGSQKIGTAAKKPVGRPRTTTPKSAAQPKLATKSKPAAKADHANAKNTKTGSKKQKAAADDDEEDVDE